MILRTYDSQQEGPTTNYGTQWEWLGLMEWNTFEFTCRFHCFLTRVPSNQW
jgi:hypothetical protein